MQLLYVLDLSTTAGQVSSITVLFSTLFYISSISNSTTLHGSSLLITVFVFICCIVYFISISHITSNVFKRYIIIIIISYLNCHQLFIIAALYVVSLCHYNLQIFGIMFISDIMLDGRQQTGFDQRGKRKLFDVKVQDNLQIIVLSVSLACVVAVHISIHLKINECRINHHNISKPFLVTVHRANTGKMYMQNLRELTSSAIRIMSLCVIFSADPFSSAMPSSLRYL